MTTGFVQRFKGRVKAHSLFLGSKQVVQLETCPYAATFTPTAGSANVSLVTIQLLDAAGNNIAVPVNMDVWLSDAATGVGLTATSASGAVTAGASGGVVLGTLTSVKALRVQTTAAGLFILSITDTGKTGFYVCAQVPGSGFTFVSAQLITANYG